MTIAMHSLRARLVAAMTAVVILFLALAGLALDRAHRHSVETGVRAGLEARVYLLLGAAELDGDGNLVMPDALAEPRFGAPDSGLYAAVRDGRGEILWRSRSSLGRSIDYPAVAERPEPVHRHPSPGGDDSLYTLAYPVTWELPGDRARRLDFLVAESASAAEARIADFRRTLASWLGAATVALLLAQTLVLAWGLRPLRRAAREVAEIEAGSRERLGGGYPVELHVLTQNLNALLAAGHRRIQRYRDALADLAHSLKTPLAVLRAREGDADLQEQVDRMERAIAWHAQRASTVGRSGLVRSVPVAEVVARVVGALEKVYADKPVEFEQAVADGSAFRGDPEDLTEIVGNLLDNAWKWCRQRVWLEARNGPDGGLELAIADDGPGIPAARRRAVLGRGVRMDEAVPGEGIGLDLVRQMVQEAYAGSLALDEADSGGLLVRVWLPAAA